tara:strand:- start:208 stop:666 length:459 start_codon:yes stop_codon:yes gene_type:complete
MSNFLSIEMFKALTIEGKKQEYKNLSLYIANNFDDVCSEDLDLQRSYALELKKGTTSQKHKALKGIADLYAGKMLKAFRGHKVKGLIDKKKGQTLRIITDIDTFGNVVESKVIVKTPQSDTGNDSKAVKIQGKAKVSCKKSGFKKGQMKLQG